MTDTPVVLSELYPAWWGGAMTVELVTVTDGSVTLPVGDVELFNHGVATAAITVGDEAWDACVLPWSQVINVHKVS
jgi:hypothetical protein